MIRDLELTLAMFIIIALLIIIAALVLVIFAQGRQINKMFDEKMQEEKKERIDTKTKE
jgi:uncharacterized protein YpmS